jgi:hypothetical protein
MEAALKKVLRASVYLILVAVAAVLAFFLGGKGNLKGYTLVTDPEAIIPTAHADAPFVAGSEGGVGVDASQSWDQQSTPGCEGGEGGEGS